MVVIAEENLKQPHCTGIIERKKNRIDASTPSSTKAIPRSNSTWKTSTPNFQKSKLLQTFCLRLRKHRQYVRRKAVPPVYINEVLSDVYYVKEEGKPKSAIQAQRTSGTDNQTIIEYIKRIHQDYNIYDDWIYVLEKAVRQPVFSKSGLGYYEYYILDSTNIDGHWSYKLKFKPKRKRKIPFYGDFWVVTPFLASSGEHAHEPRREHQPGTRIIIYEEFSPGQRLGAGQKEDGGGLYPTEGARV